MAKRSYDQYCPAARALDVIGERWTLLIVRELMSGPKRYTDLRLGLPGIAPNVLAQRLRQLQDAGIAARRTLPPPAPATVYELTELGEGLRPVIMSLMNWGVHLLGRPRAGESFNPTWLMETMEEFADREAARGVHEAYEFSINGAVFHVRVDDGEVEARPGPAEDPAFVSKTDLDTFLAVGSGELDSADAIGDGRIEFDGDPEAAQRALAILSSKRLAELRQPVAPEPVAA